MSQRVAQSPRHLYKYLLRECDRKLPENVKDYYKHLTRVQFVQHSEETDQKRIDDIMAQGVKDMEWIVTKYGKEKTNDTTK